MLLRVFGTCKLTDRLGNEKKSMTLGRMSPGIFPQTSGREEGYMGGLAPGLWPVTGSRDPLHGACVVVTFGGVCHGRCAGASPLPFCGGPLHWIRGWGLLMGSVPGATHWDSDRHVSDYPSGPH